MEFLNAVKGAAGSMEYWLKVIESLPLKLAVD